MKVVLVKEAGSLEIVERDMPSIQNQDDILVQVKMVGICGSDMHIYHGSNPLATYPRIIGHEVTGEVVAVGEAVKSFAPGDKVVLEPITPCGECYACQNGRGNVCHNLEVHGVHRDGGMQEYVVVQEGHLHKVSSSIPFENAVLVEPFTIGAQACWRGDVSEGDTVFIQGAGPIGICCLKVAELLGATCFISDLSEERLQFAKECGADGVINVSSQNPQEEIMRLTNGSGANVVIDAVCLPQTFELSVDVASVAGRVVVLGFDERSSSISQLPITKKELTIAGSRLQTKQFSKVIHWLEEGKLLVDGIVTHQYLVDDIKKAFQFIEQNPNQVRKAVVVFSK